MRPMHLQGVHSNGTSSSSSSSLETEEFVTTSAARIRRRLQATHSHIGDDASSTVCSMHYMQPLVSEVQTIEVISWVFEHT
jgi:hypothetical protein